MADERLPKKNEIKLKPKKRFGQNLLIDKNILEKIIKVAAIKKTDTVLEIGPGTGKLTEYLLKKAGKVVAVEIDRELHDQLEAHFAAYNNFQLIKGDILKLDEEEIIKLCGKKYSVIANIPYNITSMLLRKFLEMKSSPQVLLLMVQKEVAERIAAKKGQESLLSISVKYYADVELKFNVSKNCFWPKPKVDSAIIEITKRKGDYGESENFFNIVRAGFKAKRKVLISNLAKAVKVPKVELLDIFKKMGLQYSVRAQELSVEQWLILSTLLKSKK